MLSNGVAHFASDMRLSHQIWTRRKVVPGATCGLCLAQRTLNDLGLARRFSSTSPTEHSNGDSSPKFFKNDEDRRSQILPIPNPPVPGHTPRDDGARRAGIPPSRSRFGTDRPPKPNVPLAIFERTITETKSALLSDTPPSIGPSVSSFTQYQEVRRKLQTGELSIEEWYRVFDSEIRPVLRDLPGKPQHIYIHVLEGLSRVADAKAKDVTNPNLPKLKELYDLYYEFGKGFKLSPVLSIAVSTIEYLAQPISSNISDSMHTLQPGNPSESGDHHPLQSGAEPQQQNLSREDLITEVMELLTALFSTDSEPSSLQIPDIPHRNSKEYQGLLRSASKSKSDRFTAIFARILGKYNPNHLQNLPPVLLGTYAIIKAEHLESLPTVQPLSPLFALIGNLIEWLSISPSELARYFHGRSMHLQSYVQSSLKPAVSTHTGREGRRGPSDIRDFHASLSRAVRAKNTATIQQVWDNFTSLDIPSTSAGQQSYAEMLDFFIFAWCSFDRQLEIVKVMDFMESKQIPCTLRTYTSMISGWRQARKPQKVEQLWANLQEREFPFDMIIWSARISALVMCGWERQAVEVLHEMGEQWDKAEAVAAADGEAEPQQRRPHAVKPDIGPVNAVLAGIVRSKGSLAAQPILAWAAKRGIQPDITTYNTLLQGLLKEGHVAEVDNVFRLMKSRGVEPDAATFTIIVEEVLGSIHNEGPDRQMEAVNTIISVIEGSGQSVKLATYGKMIHVLLSASNPAKAAVQDIISRMLRNGTRPSPYIFAMVARFYLTRSPADIASLEDMISGWGLETTGSNLVDGVFWEIVLQGYAEAGLTAEALRLFSRLSPATGIPLGTMSTLLEALLNEDNAKAAQGIVETALSWKVPEDTAPRYWKHRFWHLALNNNLVRDIPSELRHSGGMP